MKNMLVVVFISLGFSSLLSAAPIASLGSEVDFEYASNGRDYAMRQPFALRAGYSFDVVDAYLEYAQSHTSDGADAVRINRDHHEWLAWTKLPFGPRDRHFSPFIAVGLGMQYEDVDTSFMNQSEQAGGRPAAVIAAATGLHAQLDQRWTFDLEGRVAGSSGYNPNPQFGIGFFGGYLFK